MPSPFPGMDPYLEDARLWPTFQHEFLAQLADFIRRRTRGEYSLRLSEYSYTHLLTLFTSVVQEEHREKFLEIRARNGRLVTRIELLGIGIRTLSTGRDCYLQLREATIKQGANLVELDLLLQGQSPVPVDRAHLPPFDYLIRVVRSRHPDRCELYTCTIEQRLPRIQVPLLPDDNDVLVELQEIFDRTYDRALASLVDYRKLPPVLVSEATARWIEQVLRRHRLG